MIDLRSDTVTKPSEDMRKAMASADVGDDVYGEDPTVRTLEEEVASILGKEAALYVPSGVMANQTAIAVHTRPGEEIIVEEQAHILLYEAGAAPALSGVQARTVRGVRGLPSVEDVCALVRPLDAHVARITLLCLENTHNKAGGCVLPLNAVEELSKTARRLKMSLHLDGARLWNAAVALKKPASDIAKNADSVSVCFSKGLGAPVGSAIVGSRDFIAAAHRIRKRFGGGMRQAGIIAAGALFALRYNRERLADDHAKARAFAGRVHEGSRFPIDPATVETNIVAIDVRASGHTAAEVVDALKKEGVLMGAMDAGTIRAVTHLDVTAENVMKGADTLCRLFGPKRQ